MLIAMAGLPGTGKSTLAERLADRLDGVVLNKDVVRAALFPPRVLDYSRTQDDLSMEAMYAAAEYLLSRPAALPVLIDGRTFYRSSAVTRLRACADAAVATLIIIECVCDDLVVRSRLERDLANGTHPAGNRTYDLYLVRKREAEPLTLPRLTLDTGALSLDECEARSMRYLQSCVEMA